MAAALIVGTLAWIYVTYGDTPALEGTLYGIKPTLVHAHVRGIELPPR